MEGPAHLTADFITVETPEHVTLRYELAGAVSRVLAACIDGALQLIIFVVVAIALVIVAIGASASGGWAKEASLAMVAAVFLVLFVDIWGYSVLFEIFMRGQTPGKRLLGLRVIREGGYALSPGDVIVRNLLRAADFLPFGYALGLIVMCINRSNRRIGDFVAGTLVIRDVRPMPPPPPVRSTEIRRRIDPEAISLLRRAGVHRLTGEQVRLVESFLERRYWLDMGIRRELGRQFAHQIAGFLGVDPGASEVFLMDVLLAYRETNKKKYPGPSSQ